MYLLTLYKERKDKFENPGFRKITLWREITEAMNTQLGSEFTVSQVIGRFKTLWAAYKRHTDNQSKTGRGRRDFPYEYESLVQGAQRR